MKAACFRCREILEWTQHPEFNSVSYPVRRPPRSLAKGGAKSSSLRFEVIAMSAEFIPFVEFNTVVAVPTFIGAIHKTSNGVAVIAEEFKSRKMIAVLVCDENCADEFRSRK